MGLASITILLYSKPKFAFSVRVIVAALSFRFLLFSLFFLPRQEMRLPLVACSFLVLAAVLTCATGDDIAALKETLLKMCYANKKGTFASCCLASNNGQDITSVSSVPTCFGSLSAAEATGTIQRLFVSSAAHSFGMNLRSFPALSKARN